MGETKSNNAANNNNNAKFSDKFLSQVVVRHLPPTMTAEQFKNEISPVPDHNYFHFLKADLSLGQYAFTRACINFTKREDIFIFKDKFDGYVFVDSNGTEYPAIVEFSPYQRVPRRRVNSKGEPLLGKKRDPKCGTIEDDPDYKAFIESLNEINNTKNLPSAEVYLEEIEAREKELKANHGVIKVTTPLIEFIKQKKAEKMRLKEERREERRRLQMEQKRARDDDNHDKWGKEGTSGCQQFKVKQRDRKKKTNDVSVTVVKNEKRERDREKDKDKDKDKEKDKEKEKEKKKEKNKDKDKDKDKDKERPKQLNTNREKLTERGDEKDPSEKPVNKRNRHRRKDRDSNNDRGKDGKSEATGESKNRDQGKDGDKELKKDKNVDKNRYFVVTYSGDKREGVGGRSQDSSRRSENNNSKQHQQIQSPVSDKIDTSHSNSGDARQTKRDSECSDVSKVSPNQPETSSKNSEKANNSRKENQRLRNKDRPALEIYRPRRARNQGNKEKDKDKDKEKDKDKDKDNNGNNSNSNENSDFNNDRNESSFNKSDRSIMKTKVFTRSRNVD